MNDALQLDDPVSRERHGPRNAAFLRADGWMDQTGPIIVMAGDAFIALPQIT